MQPQQPGWIKQQQQLAATGGASLSGFDAANYDNSNSLFGEDGSAVVTEVVPGAGGGPGTTDEGLAATTVAVVKKDQEDDLDMALNALKDCDDDFSKFVGDK